MFIGQNLELAEIKEFSYNGNKRYSYVFHLRQQRKYITMIGNVEVKNFKPDMCVNITISLTQDGNSFKLFVTEINSIKE